MERHTQPELNVILFNELRFAQEFKAQFKILFGKAPYLSSSDDLFLIGGTVFNNHTLYKNISAFDRACLHTITKGEITSRTYWQYTFTTEYAGIPKKELKRQVSPASDAKCATQSECLKPDTCYISLSGGYDSRFLLGPLKAMSSDIKLKTFSYGMAEQYESGDDVVASKLAESLGIEHHFEPAYAHDILKTISQNVHYGHGMANFCDEAEAEKKKNKTVLFREILNKPSKLDDLISPGIIMSFV